MKKEVKVEITCVIPIAAFLTVLAGYFYTKSQAGPKSFFKNAVIATIVPGLRGYWDTIQLEFNEKGTYQIAYLQIFSFDNKHVNQVIVIQEVPQVRKLYAGTFFKPIKLGITRNHVTEAKNLY